MRSLFGLLHKNGFVDAEGIYFQLLYFWAYSLKPNICSLGFIECMYSRRLCGGFSKRVSSVKSISACMVAVARMMQSMKSLMNLLEVAAILMRSPSNMLILMRDFE